MRIKICYPKGVAKNSMRAPTIVKTTKDYMLLKVPLPRGFRFEVGPVRRNGRLSRAEQWLWKVIQAGEREYREGKLKPIRSLRELMR